MQHFKSLSVFIMKLEKGDSNISLKVFNNQSNDSKTKCKRSRS